jgi:hypothetical protein
MKPKTVLLVPAMYAREMIPGADTEAKLASGSYILGVRPKKPSAHCIAQRDYLRRRLEAGYKKLELLLPERIFNELQSRLQKGETLAELVERLILSTGDNNQISMVDAHN